jgi:hypothetical protein
MKNGIQVITQTFIPLEDFNSFTVLGDPGCDGLGAEIASVFVRGLREPADTPPGKGDFQLVAGDIVPFGSKLFYANMADLVNASAERPVFMVCGNHDTDYYEDYFGLKDYALADSRTLVVVLDNSRRTVSEHSLAVLSQALEHYRRPNIILAMHIPPPNGVSGNAMPLAEWEKITALFAPCREQLKYIICGHLHSYFEDTLGETKLVVTGGREPGSRKSRGSRPPITMWWNFSMTGGGSFPTEKKTSTREKGTGKTRRSGPCSSQPFHRNVWPMSVTNSTRRMRKNGA